MAGTPLDVIVFDSESLTTARFVMRGRAREILNARSFRLPSGTFTPGVVSPVLADAGALAEVLRRVKADAGRLDRAAVLLPDPWFRINILELAQLPNSGKDADDVVRWALKRTLPVRPEELRIAYDVIGKSETGVKVLVVAALEKTIHDLEQVLRDSGIETGLIEPMGLNLWNAISAKEAPTTRDRLFIHLREKDFTTAVFRGETPLFIRSRNLSGERTVSQELRLSASYLRSSLSPLDLERSYVAASGENREVFDLIAQEFGVPVERVQLKDFATSTFDAGRIEPELTACTGVFAS